MLSFRMTPHRADIYGGQAPRCADFVSRSQRSAVELSQALFSMTYGTRWLASVRGACQSVRFLPRNSMTLRVWSKRSIPVNLKAGIQTRNYHGSASLKAPATAQEL